MEIKNYFAQDAQGNIMPSANCYLYLPGTTTLATGLVDGNGVPISNPFIASSVGQVEFGAPNGVYDLRVALGARDWTIKVQCADLLQALNETASFLGAKSSAPTTRNDGSALQIADRYFNTSDQLEYLYKSTGWAANNLDGQLLAASQGASLIGAVMQGGSVGTVQQAIDEGDNSLRQDLAINTGASRIGWARAVLNQGMSTVADALNSRKVYDREFYSQVIQTNPADQTTWDWSPAIQAAIDMAESLDMVAVTTPGDKWLKNPLRMGDNSRLQISHGTTLIKNFTGIDTFTGTIRGKGDATAHSNILIFGGGIIKSAAGMVGKHLVFFNVDNLVINGIRIRDTISDWTTKFQNCTNVLVDGVNINVGSTQVLTDGIHFKGASKRLVVVNCNIRTGDDCIAFTQEVAPVDEAGDIEDFVVANCVLDTSQSSLIKMHIRPETTTRIRRGSIYNVTGKVGRINAGGFAFYLTDDGLTQRISDIHIDGVNGACLENGDYCARVVGCRDIQIDNFIAYEALRGILIEDSKYITINNPRIHPIRGVGGQASSGIIVQNVDWFTINNPKVSGSSQHGVQIGTAGKPGRYGSITGGWLYGNTSTGVRLTNADGVTVTSVTCYLNNNGIVEDAGSDNNRLVTNDVRNNNTITLAVNGANTKIVKNIGHLDVNYGEAVVDSGATTVVVTHGLAGTPGGNNIRVTPKNSMGAAAKFWVSGVTATQFTINVNVDPGAPTASFGWNASLNQAN